MKKLRAFKKYKYIEHPSDTGIEFYGNTLEELFSNAAAGMFSIICDLRLIKQEETRVIKISSKGIEYEDLIVLWLERLLYLHEVESMLFSRFEVKKIVENSNNIMLDARVYGERIDFNRHEIKIAIKAPTYHTLGIEKDSIKNSWQGRIIFDV